MTPILFAVLYFLFLKFIFRPVKIGFHVEDQKVIYHSSKGPFSDGQWTTTLNPASFRSLNHQFAIDNEFVFYRNLKIEKADPESFKVLDGSFSLDKNFVYFKDKILPGLNPQKTKRLVKDNQVLISDQSTTYNHLGKKVD